MSDFYCICLCFVLFSVSTGRKKAVVFVCSKCFLLDYCPSSFCFDHDLP